jgi:hypothetical protein
MVTTPATSAALEVSENKGPNFLLPTLAVVALIGCATLYVAAPKTYSGLLGFFGFTVWPYPFFDAEAVAAGISCWHSGIDVFASNPCDRVGRAGIYSPLWLWIPSLPTGGGWTNVYGLISVIAFIVALGSLPRARTPIVALFMVFALMSPAVVFAVERANADLLMFALTMLAIVLLEGSLRVRLAGYIVVMLAGLLKYYPIALLVFVAGERPIRAIAITAGCVLTTIVLIWLEFDALSKAIHYSVAPASMGLYETDCFGAASLGQFFADIAHHRLGVEVSSYAITIGVTICAASGGFALARRSATLDALHALSTRESLCLVAGSLLFCFCFFASVNVLYKAIFALLFLPGLLAPTGAEAEKASPADWRAAAGAILLAIWFQPLESLLAFRLGWFDFDSGVLAAPTLTIFFWLLRQSLWWAGATVLLSIIFCFVNSSTASREFGLITGRNLKFF